jgi:hypothetical protein
MSRLTSINNSILGTFTPAYVDQGAGGGDKGTTRLASFTYPEKRDKTAVKTGQASLRPGICYQLS